MYQKTVLGNGLRVVSESLPHSRVTSIGIWVDVGSRDEHDLNNGSAHFAEHMLFKGTVNRSAKQIAKELDVLGGNANAFTSRENTCFYATVLDSHLPQLVDLLADIFLNSKLSDDDIELERQVILQEINMVEDTPDDHIHDLFSSLIWDRHPLRHSVLGSREVVAFLDSKKLNDYIRHYYSADRIIISAAGNLNHDDFVAMLQDKGFAGLIADRANNVIRQKPTNKCSNRCILSKPLEQVHMLLGSYGLSAVSKERYAFLLANVLLGGNMSSRLFQEIRESRGLAYSVYSYITSYTDCGYLAIYLGIDRRSVNDALTLVFQEINSLRKAGASPDELKNAKNYVTGGLYMSMESMESIMSRLARNESCFGRYISMEQVVEGIDRVTAGDIALIMEQVFSNYLMTLAAIGPLDSEEIDWALLSN